jgi:GTPase SAR1 family protein
VVSKADAESKAKSWNVPYLETSAKTKQNVDEAYKALLRLIIAKKNKEKAAQKTKKRKKKCLLL